MYPSCWRKLFISSFALSVALVSGSGRVTAEELPPPNEAKNSSRDNQEGRDKDEKQRQEKRRSVENEIREVQVQIERRANEMRELQAQAEKLRNRMREMGGEGQGKPRLEEKKEMRIEIRNSDGPGSPSSPSGQAMMAILVTPDGKQAEVRTNGNNNPGMNSQGNNQGGQNNRPKMVDIL